MASLVTAIVSATALAGTWEVSDADSFGWRRALVTLGDDRLAVVCPPDQRPFAVPVTTNPHRPEPPGRFTLGLGIDGARHDQPMTCSEVLCEADLSQETWRALATGDRVTVWIDDWRGPTFPLDGSAEALRACSPSY
jgi:hypothetical protein